MAAAARRPPHHTVSQRSRAPRSRGPYQPTGGHHQCQAAPGQPRPPGCPPTNGIRPPSRDPRPPTSNGGLRAEHHRCVTAAPRRLCAGCRRLCAGLCVPFVCWTPFTTGVCGFAGVLRVTRLRVCGVCGASGVCGACRRLRVARASAGSPARRVTAAGAVESPACSTVVGPCGRSLRPCSSVRLLDLDVFVVVGRLLDLDRLVVRLLDLDRLVVRLLDLHGDCLGGPVRAMRRCRPGWPSPVLERHADRVAGVVRRGVRRPLALWTGLAPSVGAPSVLVIRALRVPGVALVRDCVRCGSRRRGARLVVLASWCTTFVSASWCTTFVLASWCTTFVTAGLAGSSGSRPPWGRTGRPPARRHSQPRPRTGRLLRVSQSPGRRPVCSSWVLPFLFVGSAGWLGRLSSGCLGAR